MIVAHLHQQATPLDRDLHRQVALAVPWSDWSIVQGMNSVFVALGEFAQACLDFPIVFIRADAGDAATPEYAPVAVLGLAADENLFVEGAQWRGRYQPIVYRCYPFGIARVDAERYALCFDAAWVGVRPEGDGQRLFTDDGEPTEFTTTVQQQLEAFEADIDRTRRGLGKLASLGLMREMRFDGTMGDGQKVAVDGFYVVDEAKLRALPDEAVLELHRDGLLAPIHAHWFSLAHMQRLLEWRTVRVGAAAAAS